MKTYQIVLIFTDQPSETKHIKSHNRVTAIHEALTGYETKDNLLGVRILSVNN